MITVEDKRTDAKSKLLSQSKNSSVSTYMLVSILSAGYVHLSDLPTTMQMRVEKAASEAGLSVEELIGQKNRT